MPAMIPIRTFKRESQTQRESLRRKSMEDLFDQLPSVSSDSANISQRPAKIFKKENKRQEVKKKTMQELFVELDNLPVCTTSITPVRGSQLDSVFAIFPPLKKQFVQSSSPPGEIMKKLEFQTEPIITQQTTDVIEPDQDTQTIGSDSSNGDLFQTNFEMQNDQMRTKVSDELDFFLEGLSNNATTGNSKCREGALLSLLQWMISDKEFCVQLRAENKIKEIIKAATQFNPADTIISGPCLLVLLFILQDPLNHLHVTSDVWGAFFSVLKHSTSRIISASSSSSSSTNNCNITSINTKIDSSTSLTNNNNGLQRTRSLKLVKQDPQENSSSKYSVLKANVLKSVDDQSDPVCLAVTGLVSSILIHNKTIAMKESKSSFSQDFTSAASVFVRWFISNDGFNVINSLLEEIVLKWNNKLQFLQNVQLLLKILKFLELLTCYATNNHMALSESHESSIESIVTTLSSVLLLASNSYGPSNDTIFTLLTGEILGVIINFCAHKSHWFRKEGPFIQDLLKACCSILSFSQDFVGGDDITNLCMCLLINMSEKDAIMRHKISTCDCNGESIITFLVRLFDSRLSQETTIDNIVASYAALLLGCLTIDHDRNRKCVCSALSSCCSASVVDPSDPNSHIPMARIVAVLQQFILFQSDANVLTHSTLLGLYHVITEVAKCNDIILPAARQQQQQQPQFSSADDEDSDKKRHPMTHLFFLFWYFN